MVCIQLRVKWPVSNKQKNHLEREEEHHLPQSLNQKYATTRFLLAENVLQTKTLHFTHPIVPTVLRYASRHISMQLFKCLLHTYYTQLHCVCGSSSLPPTNQAQPMDLPSECSTHSYTPLRMSEHLSLTPTHSPYHRCPDPHSRTCNSIDPTQNPAVHTTHHIYSLRIHKRVYKVTKTHISILIVIPHTEHRSNDLQSNNTQTTTDSSLISTSNKISTKSSKQSAFILNITKYTIKYKTDPFFTLRARR